MNWWQRDFWQTGWLLLLLGVPAFVEATAEALEIVPPTFDMVGFMMGAAWGFLIFAIARATGKPVAATLQRINVRWPMLLLFALLFPLLPLLLSC
ncbi:MAG: hypothetical protein OXH92_02250 [Bryobacterales bacterium]|nr:hypothetical protein [Bryobacterales bacterium]MDE0432808.1 hypothetical protein [Bryobacterales bacterium]